MTSRYCSIMPIIYSSCLFGLSTVPIPLYDFKSKNIIITSILDTQKFILNVYFKTESSRYFEYLQFGVGKLTLQTLYSLIKSLAQLPVSPARLRPPNNSTQLYQKV